MFTSHGMYGQAQLGEDVPLILQGGGAYNTPPAITRAAQPIVLYGVVGLLAAYFIFGRSGRKLW